MNDRRYQKRRRTLYCKPTEENAEEVEVVIHQQLFIPSLVIVISLVLAFAAIKGVAPIAERLAASQSKIDAAEEKTAEKIMPEGQIASFFSPEVKYWQPYIAKWAKQYQLDANLIATVMQIESCGDATALSNSGAMGLFQVMPFHFEPGENAFDPLVNAKRGLEYLRKAYQTVQGDIRTTLASYNGGIQGASQPEMAWSDQMQRYVKWGMGIYQDALAGKKESETLNEWLAAGGSRLCDQARQKLETMEGMEEYTYKSP